MLPLNPIAIESTIEGGFGDAQDSGCLRLVARSFSQDVPDDTAEDDLLEFNEVSTDLCSQSQGHGVGDAFLL